MINITKQEDGRTLIVSFDKVAKYELTFETFGVLEEDLIVRISQLTGTKKEEFQIALDDRELGMTIEAKLKQHHIDPLNAYLITVKFLDMLAKYFFDLRFAKIKEGAPARVIETLQRNYALVSSVRINYKMIRNSFYGSTKRNHPETRQHL